MTSAEIRIAAAIVSYILVYAGFMSGAYKGEGNKNAYRAVAFGIALFVAYSVATGFL